MGARSDRKLARIKRNLEEELYNPFTSPERAEQILYALRDSDARRTGVLASQIQNIHHIKRGEPSHGYILGGSQSFPRNIIVEKADLRIKKASSKLPSYSSEYLPATISKPVSFFPFNKYDFVGKRSRFIRTAVGQTTDIVPWSPSLDAEMSAKYGKVGPEQPKRFNERGNKNFEYDIMDEFDQKMHDLTERYGGDKEKADISYRKILQKEFPQFFKNSKMSTKDMHNMAKTLRSMSKIPLVGHAITHPGLAALSASMWAINGLTAGRMAGNEAVVKRQNIAGVWGKPSDKFIAAAKNAGLKDEEIDKAWSQLSSQYIDPEMLAAFSGIDPGFAKGKIMESLGLNEDYMRIIDAMGGAPSSDARKENEIKHNLDTVETRGLSAGTSWWTKLQALKYKIPVIGGLIKENDIQTQIANRNAREWMSKHGFSIPPSYDNMAINDVERVVYAAAQSDASYDATHATNPSPSGTLTPSVAGSTNNWYGTTIITDADKMDGIAADAEKTANARTEQRLNAAITADPKGQ